MEEIVAKASANISNRLEATTCQDQTDQGLFLHYQPLGIVYWVPHNLLPCLFNLMLHTVNGRGYPTYIAIIFLRCFYQQCWQCQTLHAMVGITDYLNK